MSAPVVPSPKSHVNARIESCGSVDCDALNVTSVPGETSVPLAAKDATGGYEALTESVSYAVAVNPSDSVTVRATG